MRRALHLFLLFAATTAQAAEQFPGTKALDSEGDLAARMVQGIDKYLDRDQASIIEARRTFWRRDPNNYDGSIQKNREELSRILGLIDVRSKPHLEIVHPFTTVSPTNLALAVGRGLSVFQVKWNVLRDVHGEGLLLEPATPRANVVAIPDADWTPEDLAGLTSNAAATSFARALAESGCRVLVPTLIDRSDTNSGALGLRKIRQSQREVLWRASYQMGRTLAGYEVEKVRAAVDWFKSSSPGLPVGVIGYGEGGMVALFSAALDPRIDSTGVLGYFQPREQIHHEPIYRNIWSFLTQFGDAELATMVTPRNLVIESGRYPVGQYPAPGAGSDGAAPGKLVQPPFADVMTEVERARQLVPGFAAAINFVEASTNEVATAATLQQFLKPLKLAGVSSGSEPLKAIHEAETSERQKRQYTEIMADTQHLMRESEFVRAGFWKKADRKSATAFEQSTREYKDYFWNEIVGKLPKPTLPPNVRSRLVSETDAFKGYEVVLDLYEDVFAFGILLVPKDIKPGEKRPVVVCQHGLEGRPRDVADPKLDNPAYHAYACRLAEKGFITFAPQNPYIGQNVFRQVLRKGQPLKRTLFSFIVRQHETILDWLAGLEMVDASRMAFYGLSYGGKTAMRVPPLLDRYCLSICSADYNEWIWKNVSIRHPYCYLYGGEYDMPEFNLGNTFNYAELSWLILPRPFMVERGHDDGVAPDEWVAYEFAKTRRTYDKLGLGERVALEIFDGPHTINGKGTFEFLMKHLRFPEGAQK